VKVAVIAVAALLFFGFVASSATPTPAVAPGVTVNGVKVGGLGSETARAVVRRTFERRLTIVDGAKRWTVRPQGLGARASVDRAVRQALEADPRAAVKVPVAVSTRNIRTYVDYLAHKYTRAPVNARLVGTTKRLSPVIAGGVAGRGVSRTLMEQRITTALRSPVHRTIALATSPVSPKVTKQNFGPVIVIGRSSHRLRLFDGSRLVHQFGVATGQPAYPTPLGTYAIVTMQRDPWWTPPNSAWAAGEQPVPPGPGNPLGTRWMGLSAPSVGIHGTPDAASIGYSASHGCIRMRVPDAEWLFDHVRVGTPVAIVDA
jgi:lipoprotein-anchoring transpeptidase ErfK/SrfK